MAKNHLLQCLTGPFGCLGQLKYGFQTAKLINLMIVGLVLFPSTAIHMASNNFNPNTLQQIPYKTSWLGNTFSGGSKWVQNRIGAMHVASDGTIYTNSVWDEAGREVGIYKDGDVIGKAKELHGWGRNGGEAVTANSKYLFVGMSQIHSGNPFEDYPAEGTTWHCVRRYDLFGNPAPFDNGRGYDKSMLIVSTSGSIKGLATAGNELYVSDSAADRVHVYNANTMAKIRSWSVNDPEQIAVDEQKNLWIDQEGANNTSQISHYSNRGRFLSKKITDVVDPTALAIDPHGRLLIADNGPRQQVLIYEVTETPTLVETLGVEGGIYSGIPGEVGSHKFNGLTGVGTDATGNIYVSNDGFGESGTDLRAFSPSGDLQWQLLGLEFVDNADVDPATDGVDVFTKHERFVMDYSKENGQEWSYKAYTLDPFRYPDDPRLHDNVTSVFVRRIEGKRFLYITGMYANQLSVYRFDGEIAVPTAILSREHSDWPSNQPATGSWLWRDKNGDGSIQTDEYESLGAADGLLWGWEVDSNGDIWQASGTGYIKHYSYQGLDTFGSPIYSGAASKVMPAPEPFNRLERVKYFPDTDVMYLGGYTGDRPYTGSEWGIVGTEIVRYDNWSTNRTPRWRTTLPYDPNADPILIIKAMDIAGDRVFAVDSRKAEVYIFNAETGAFETKLSPGLEVNQESGWIDIPYGLRAYRRSNGEYVVLVEEDAKAKIIMYRFNPGT
jgi:DNA-binding beta-propeller fold protein YncE